MIQTIARIFPAGRRRSAAAQQRLVEAYTKTFTGTATTEDAEVVMADLAKFTGYFHTTGADQSDRAIWRQEGMRAVFGRIAFLTHTPPEALQALMQAVALEDHASNEEGNDL